MRKLPSGKVVSSVVLSALLGASSFVACGDSGEVGGPTSPDGGGNGDATLSDSPTGTGDSSVKTDGTTGDAPNPPGDGGADGSVPVDASDDGSGPLDHSAVPGDAGPCTTAPPTLPALKIVDVSSTALSAGFYAIQPPNSDDWYVTEQGGKVKIIRNGAVLATAFLDISAAMGTNAGERGLLSIAFHPHYAANGRFFIMGTPTDNANGDVAPANSDAVVEYRRDPANPDRALATKVRDIVILPASDSNHNGGTIKFGPDNYLYVGTGDGGGGCESSKPGQVQDTTKLFGKILRLDVDGTAPFGAPGNPFANDPRVYHYGLRNPFRWNFDPITHDLFIGDVGQSTNEEVSVAANNVAGKNFGWPAYEGATQDTCGGKQLGGPSPYTPPIVSIDRTGGSSSPFKDYSSIVGGRVYRGNAITALKGVYLFADFSGGELGAINWCNGTAYGPTVRNLSDIPTPTGTLANVSSFIEGHDGELYVTYGYGTSHLGKIVPQ